VPFETTPGDFIDGWLYIHDVARRHEAALQ
jgi:hypothetical protein